MSVAGYYDHICLVYIHCVFLSCKDTLLQQQYRNGSTNKGLLSCLWDRDSLVLALGKTSCFADWFQSARKPIWSFRAVIANGKGRLYVVKRVFKSPKREGHSESNLKATHRACLLLSSIMHPNCSWARQLSWIHLLWNSWLMPMFKISLSFTWC